MATCLQVIKIHHFCLIVSFRIKSLFHLLSFSLSLSLALARSFWNAQKMKCRAHTMCTVFIVNDEAGPVFDRFQAQPNTNDYVNLVRYARVDVVRALSASQHNTNNNHSYQNRETLLFEFIMNFRLTHSNDAGTCLCAPRDGAVCVRECLM